MTLDELFQKRKAQCKALKEAGNTEELAKREAQMESLSSKLIGVAIRSVSGRGSVYCCDFLLLRTASCCSECLLLVCSIHT